MMLLSAPPCAGVYEFESDEKICKLNSPFFATYDKIELDDFCPTTAPEVVENLSGDNEKGVDIESPLEEQN